MTINNNGSVDLNDLAANREDYCEHLFKRCKDLADNLGEGTSKYADELISDISNLHFIYLYLSARQYGYEHSQSIKFAQGSSKFVVTEKDVDTYLGSW